MLCLVQAMVYPFRISQEGFIFGSTQADKQNKEGVDRYVCDF